MILVWCCNMPGNKSKSISRVNQSDHGQEIILEEFDSLDRMVLPVEINLIATHCSALLIQLALKKTPDPK